ncbi:MAG: undecaprenyl-phosphate glucose phosphotransferase [Myxococcota bacterium]|nr:undecaprenyl-phosphate glucose phosphotransferase [Myxococcota bacterium]
MLKQHPKTFEALQVVRDSLGLSMAFAGASLGKLPAESFEPFVVSWPRESLLLGALAVVSWLLVAYVSGLYTSFRARGLAAELFLTFRTSVVAFFLLVTVTYFVGVWQDQRAMFLAWLPLSFMSVGALHVFSRVGLWWLRSAGYNLRHVVVVGGGELARDIVARLTQRRELGLKVMGVVSDQSHAEAPSESGPRYLADSSELVKLVSEGAVDQVIVALPVEELVRVAPLMDKLGAFPVEVKLVPDVMQHITLCGSMEELAGLPALNLQGQPLAQMDRGLKRTFDVSMSLGLMVLSAPVILLVAGLVGLSGGGPILHRQRRVGLDGREFTMLKFRSMVADAEKAGPSLTTDHDPRCTPVGRWLRRYSLDELPQLWNVLVGDMSLVGPRPEQPAFVEELAAQIPRYALRHRVKSGMTGWAQVHGLRGNSSMAKRVEYDLYYIENWSFFLDLKILVRTCLGGFLSPNAY